MEKKRNVIGWFYIAATSKRDTTVSHKLPPCLEQHFLFRCGAASFPSQSGARDVLGSHVYCPASLKATQQDVRTDTTAQSIPGTRLTWKWSSTAVEQEALLTGGRDFSKLQIRPMGHSLDSPNIKWLKYFNYPKIHWNTGAFLNIVHRWIENAFLSRIITNKMGQNAGTYTCIPVGRLKACLLLLFSSNCRFPLITWILYVSFPPFFGSNTSLWPDCHGSGFRSRLEARK